jgi:alpha-galactosidase/6-phospho-beta-glucosidase family protein
LHSPGEKWHIAARYDGKDWTDRLLEGFEKHREYSWTEKVRIDVLRRFGFYSTESNGHLPMRAPGYREEAWRQSTISLSASRGIRPADRSARWWTTLSTPG